VTIERRWMSAYIRTDMPDADVIQNVRDSLANFVEQCTEDGLTVDWDSLYFRTEPPVIVTDAAGNETAYRAPLILGVESVRPA